MQRSRHLLVLLLLLAVGTASAQCERGPTTSELSIQGFGAAYFQQVRTDSAHDSVEFYGGVCLTGEGVAWTLLAQRVTVRGLSGQLSVSAELPTVHFEGWTMTAASLHADRRTLTLSTVRVAGKQLNGDASAVTVDLQKETLRLQHAVLEAPTYVVRGASAVVAGDGVTIDRPLITTCTCAGPPLYDVQGRSARLDLQGGTVVLQGGRLRAGAVTLLLADTITLSEKTLKDLTVPVKVSYVASDVAAGVTGTGLGVTVGPLGLGPGVHADLGATGLDADYPLSAVALLAGKGAGGSFTFGKAPDGMRFEMTSDHPVLPWLDAGFDTRVLEPGNRDTLREGVLHLRAHTRLPALGGDAALALVAAGSSQEPAAGPVAGARLGATGSFQIGTAAAAWGRLTLRTSLSESLYPDQGASQWGVDLQPGYSVRAGGVDLSASYLARFTDSGSPFTTTLDRLEPAQRPSLQVTARGALGPGWSGSSKVVGSYDLVASPSVDAGVNRLEATASVARQLGPWRLQVGVDTALQGVLAPNGERDGYLQGSVSAADGGLQFGARARYTWAPDPVGLDRLELSAAVPIELPGVELTPYLALNFAPTVTGGALPAISGHGLDLTFVSCCGALQLGYRDQDGTWSVSVSVDLQRRTATDAQAGTSGCGSPLDGPATLASTGTASTTCSIGGPGNAGSTAPPSVSAAGTGIMAGAATVSSPP